MIFTIICEDKTRKNEYIEHIVNNCIGVAHLPVRVLLSSSDPNHSEMEEPQHLLGYSQKVDSLENLLEEEVEHPKYEIIEVRDLKIDVSSRRVWLNGEELYFTMREFDILTLLAKNPERVVSKKELFGERLDRERTEKQQKATIAVHIKNIRNNIEPNSKISSYIETVRGIGYRFKA